MQVSSEGSSKHCSNACLHDLSAQFEAFKTLLGSGPLPAPELPSTLGVSTLGLKSACLNEDITLDELCSCIKCLQCGKSPGIAGFVADMIKDGGHLAIENKCLLWLFHRMLTNSFPEHLSVGTVVYKFGNKSDVSNYRGITVCSVIAKLFAMILQQRLAS